MLDVGFWEIMAISVIALLVIGPDRLPEVARTLGRWIGRARAYIDSIRNIADKEMRLQELQTMMQQSERNDLYEMLEEAPKADTNTDKPSQTTETNKTDTLTDKPKTTS